MAYDYKKTKNKPGIVKIPTMNYLAVRGSGNPNEAGRAYQASIGLLYNIALTIKMSYKGDHQIDGYFSYVMPPLECLWWQEDMDNIDCVRKDKFHFISMIQLPDFVTKTDFDLVIAEAEKKKKLDFSKVEFFTYNEGLCVQCIHLGAYDNKSATIETMHTFARENGYMVDITDTRYYHEIYLSDTRKCTSDKLRTVVRHPVKKY